MYSEYLTRTCLYAIIPDVRFEEEADVLDWLIVIDRDVPKLNHPSEDLAWNLIQGYRDGAPDDYLDALDIMNSAYIKNNGTIQELRTELEDTWEYMNWS